MRSGLDPSEFEESILRHIADWNLFRRAEDVLIYMALPGEVDLGPLASLGRDAPGTKRFHLTRTGTATAGLSIHLLEMQSLERHPFGFLQPPAHAPETPLETIDLVLVPGLAFDRRGTRLGFGRGLYDRLLGKLANNVPLAGVTPSALLVPALPREAHDIPMTHLVTENGVTEIRERPQQQTP